MKNEIKITSGELLDYAINNSPIELTPYKPTVYKINCEKHGLHDNTMYFNDSALEGYRGKAICLYCLADLVGCLDTAQESE